MSRSTILAVSPILIFIVMICSMVGCGVQANEYTFEKWQKEPTQRINIVSDLLKKNALVGLDRSEMLSLLGEPSIINTANRGVEIGEWPERVFYLAEGRYLTYLLTEEFPPEKARALYIELDDKDIAVSVCIVSLQT